MYLYIYNKTRQYRMEALRSSDDILVVNVLNLKAMMDHLFR